jgi:hypothetical protein
MTIRMSKDLAFSVTQSEQALARIMVDFCLIPDFERDVFDTALSRSINYATGRLTDYQRACVIIKDLGELAAFQKMEFNIQALISTHDKQSCARALSIVIMNNLRNWFRMYVKQTYPDPQLDGSKDNP